MFVLYGVRSKGKVIGTTKASESCMNCGKTSFLYMSFLYH